MYMWKADFPRIGAFFLRIKRLFKPFAWHNCLKNSYAKTERLVVLMVFKLTNSIWTNFGHERGHIGQLWCQYFKYR